MLMISGIMNWKGTYDLSAPFGHLWLDRHIIAPKWAFLYSAWPSLAMVGTPCMLFYSAPSEKNDLHLGNSLVV